MFRSKREKNGKQKQEKREREGNLIVETLIFRANASQSTGAITQDFLELLAIIMQKKGKKVIVMRSWECGFLQH